MERVLPSVISPFQQAVSELSFTRNGPAALGFAYAPVPPGRIYRMSPLRRAGQ